MPYTDSTSTALRDDGQVAALRRTLQPESVRHHRTLDQAEQVLDEQSE